MQAEFIGQKLNVLSTTINNYTHNYTLELPQLAQKACGKQLTVTTTRYNGTLTEKIKIYMSKCKYGYYVHLNFEALVYKNIIW